MSPASIHNLIKRAEMLAQARSFFKERNIIEVDVPIFSFLASVDAHIDLIPALYNRTKKAFLHSSPEYGMKRLLAHGLGDIYQLSHVFRDGEESPKHNPEFMLCEWYRVNAEFQPFIEETLDFIRLFLGPLPYTQMTYRETFQKYLGLDFTTLTPSDLVEFIRSKGVIPYDNIEDEGKDGALSLILSHFIEPSLGQNELFVLSHYPATQAALAKTTPLEGYLAAERFEVYYRGVELCNGYHELVDPLEQTHRLEAANLERIRLGKDSLPIDTRFLVALSQGCPPACGVAAGFDRLLMLMLNASSLEEVVPFTINNA